MRFYGLGLQGFRVWRVLGLVFFYCLFFFIGGGGGGGCGIKELIRAFIRGLIGFIDIHDFGGLGFVGLNVWVGFGGFIGV